MPKVLPLAVLLSSVLAGGSAQSQSIDAAVKACRELTDASRRLACYDAVPLPSAVAPAAAATAPAAPVAAPPAADPVAKFGQESVKPPTDAPPELKQIESRVRGRFAGWGASTRIELENGQVWRVADGSSAFYDLQNPKVIVHRGMLGAFFLEIEGIGFQIKVTRVR